MYANLKVAVTIDHRTAEYGATQVVIGVDQITIDLDGGEGNDELGRLTIKTDNDAEIGIAITADY